MNKDRINPSANAAGIKYGELIRRQRKAMRMNQEELGALVHVGKNAVGAWEAGRSRPDVGSVPVICEALSLSLEEFFGIPERESPRRKGADNFQEAERESLLERYAALDDYNRKVILRQMDALLEIQESERIPPKVICLFRNEQAVSAGPGEMLNVAMGEPVWLFADRVPAHADEIIPVHGDSMEPTYSDGDQVLVRHTSVIRPGEVGVFICGDTGYIKEYRTDGLYSHNPRYATLTFHEGEDVRCIGKVLGKIDDNAFANDESVKAWKKYSQKEGKA